MSSLSFLKIIFINFFSSKIEQLQGKQAVMKLLSADDPNVRYHSLLAIQKLMVHNWEYLGKQLDADSATTAAE